MRKRGIIERIIMGKEKETDFTEADLPTTRFKQFKHVFKTRFGIIFRANLLSALFWLPLIVWSFYAMAYVDVFTKGMTPAEHFSHLIFLTLLRHGVSVPLFMLAVAGLSGIYYVVRRLCWGQPVRLVSDFGRGLKDSYAQYLWLGLLAGLVNLFVRYIVDFALLTMSDSNALVWGLAMTAAILFAIVFCIILMYAFCFSTLYKVSFGALLKNGFILTFKRLWRSLLFCFVSLLPVIIFAAMPWVFVKIIGACVALVFSIGFAVTVQTVFCHSVFDEFVNKKSYPDFVGMGLAGGKTVEEILAKEDSESQAEANDENLG